MKFIIFADPSLVIITLFSLFDLCLRIEEKMFQNTNNAFSVYNLYDHIQAQESLHRGSRNLQFL